MRVDVVLVRLPAVDVGAGDPDTVADYERNRGQILGDDELELAAGGLQLLGVGGLLPGRDGVVNRLNLGAAPVRARDCPEPTKRITTSIGTGQR